MTGEAEAPKGSLIAQHYSRVGLDDMDWTVMATTGEGKEIESSLADWPIAEAACAALGIERVLLLRPEQNLSLELTAEEANILLNDERFSSVPTNYLLKVIRIEIAQRQAEHEIAEQPQELPPVMGENGLVSNLIDRLPVRSANKSGSSKSKNSNKYTSAQ